MKFSIQICLQLGIENPGNPQSSGLINPIFPSIRVDFAASVSSTNYVEYLSIVQSTP
jgi:hypothetical protein